MIKKFSDKGASVSQIKEQSGLPDKKLRNIIFRLTNDEKIETKKRGIYLVKQKGEDNFYENT